MRASRNLTLACLIFLSPIVSPTFVCPGLGFYPDPTSCTAFYRCISLQMSYRYICPLGTSYDPTVRNCNHNELAPPCRVGQSGSLEIQGDKLPELQEDIFPGLQEDIFPGLQEDIFPGHQEDIFPGLQEDIFPGQQEDIFPGVQEDIFPGLQEDVSHELQGDISPEPQEDIFPELQGDIFPDLQEDIFHGLEEDISHELQEDISNELHEDISSDNINNGADTRPGQTTEHALITEDQSLSSTNKPQQTTEPEGNYLVSPISLYPCKQPGYYNEKSSCTQFYVCREVAPGVLSADRIFRCPERYVFDVTTQLCQRKKKVTCDRQNLSFLYYAFRSSFVVQLHQSQLQQFFSQSLLIPKARTVPISNQFGYPWMILPSHVY